MQDVYCTDMANSITLGQLFGIGNYWVMDGLCVLHWGVGACALL